MVFTKMEVLLVEGESLGYLASGAGYRGIVDCLTVTDLENAYLYEWVDCDNSYWRLDQGTSGGNRSLTYMSADWPDSLMLACWGLGDNWIYLRQKDGRICYERDSVTCTLRLWSDLDYVYVFTFEDERTSSDCPEVKFRPVTESSKDTT